MGTYAPLPFRGLASPPAFDDQNLRANDHDPLAEHELSQSPRLACLTVGDEVLDDDDRDHLLLAS